MEKKILVLDRAGLNPPFVASLEAELNYRIKVSRELSALISNLDTDSVCGVIVNPYYEPGGVIEAYAEFVRGDLKKRKVPTMIFSRTGVEKLAERAGLRMPEDYQVYLKKPAPVDKFVEAVKRLIGEG